MDREHQWPIPSALSLFEWYQGFAGEEGWGVEGWWGWGEVANQKVHKNPLCKNKKRSLYATYQMGKKWHNFYFKNNLLSECVVGQIFFFFKLFIKENFTHIIKSIMNPSPASTIINS